VALNWGGGARATHIASCSQMPPTGQQARCTLVKDQCCIKTVGGANGSRKF
jgi:hypothetical protein